MTVVVLWFICGWLRCAWRSEWAGLRLAVRDRGYGPRKQLPSSCRGQRKPVWVQREVLRLAALTGNGCRSIADLFNRLHALSRSMTVSKSFVAYTVRAHRYEIEDLRRQIRRRPPRPTLGYAVWALDLTGKGDAAGQIHSVLGIEDHGSRALLVLEVLQRRNAWTLLGHLFLAVGRFGRPRAIRTDNEAVFRGRVFRSVLKLANVRQQFTVLGCPWMNGRIERLFGSLKQKLDQLQVDSRAALVELMAEFRTWYNHVRPHQNLGGVTPAEAWSGVDPYAQAPRQAIWFEAWDGLLTGYYLRR